MDADSVRQVRRFNRLVTQRVGALDDRYLARDRPLGEARLLWEIGDEGRGLRVLRADLDLDSGYLSRLLRSLEAARLVVVARTEGDGRIRVARLTKRGRAERALLDQRSDELAESILAPLNEGQRRRLLAAMGEVERLLTAATVTVRDIDPAHEAARHCLSAYVSELERRFDSGFVPERSISADPADLRAPFGLLVVAFLRTEPIGCGAVKFHGRGPGEIKRMWVAKSARGLGVGRRLLTELEARAASHGCRVVRLETNRALAEAISMYRSAGYVEVAPFNDEPYAHHWFEKRLA